jgi:putative ABC transport system permease protein
VGIAFGGAMIIVGNFSYDAVDRMIELQFDLAQRYDALVTFARPASPDALHELRRLPGILDVEPFRAVPVRLRVGHRSHEGSIQGLPSGGRLNRLIDASGRVVSLPPGGLVMSKKLAEILHVAPGDDVTVEVLEGRRPVARVRLARVIEDYVGTSAYMEAGALHRLMHEAPTLSGAFLEVDSSAVDELFRHLKATPAVAGVMLEQAALESFRETLAENVGIVRTINVVFAIIIAFGVIYNNARTALSERARELATLRVIGFTRAEISYILLGELAILTLVATVVGLGLGYLLAYYTAQAFDTEVYRIPLVVARGTYALSAATVLGASLLSALAVRRRLHRLDLIAVLKTRE